MPTNTFGPNDNYHVLNYHFFTAFFKKIKNIKKNNKKKIVLWGNGLAKREVIFVDDLADACIYFMNKKVKESVINIGIGKDYSIRDYLKLMIKLINKSLIKVIKIYKYFISPFFPSNCRYLPTCSEYAIESLKFHGLLRGLFFTIKRISKCHPFGGHGLDPIPKRKQNKVL